LNGKAKRDTSTRVVPERRRTGGRNSPIEFAFTTPLQLEECLARLEEKNRALFSNVCVQLFRVDDDCYNFRFMYREKADLTDAVGQMRRWEGTATRFKGEAMPHYSVVEDLMRLMFLLFGGMAAFAALSSGHLIVLGLAVLWLGIPVLWMRWREWRHRRLITTLQKTVAPKRGRKRG
jgi:hypothetical protein